MSLQYLRENVHFYYISSYSYPQKSEGVAIYTYERAKEISSIKIQCTIICANIQGFKKEKTILNDYGEINFLPVLNKNRITFLITFIISSIIFFLKEKNSKKIPILDSQFLGIPSIISLILSTLFRMKMIVTCHGSDITTVRNKFFFKILQDIVLTRSEKVLVVSDHLKTLLEKQNLSKDIIKVNLGFKQDEIIDTDVEKKSLPFRNPTPQFLFVGRLDQNKNPLAAIFIIENTLQMKCPISFYIIGDGVLREIVIERIIRSKYSNYIRYLGAKPHDEVIRIMEQSDCLIMTSNSEGTPLSLLEAMSKGLICFVNSIDSISRIIEDKVNGIYIESSNVNKSAQRIMNTLQDISKISEIRKNAVLTIKARFSKKKNLGKYLHEIILLFDK